MFSSNCAADSLGADILKREAVDTWLLVSLHPCCCEGGFLLCVQQQLLTVNRGGRDYSSLKPHNILQGTIKVIICFELQPEDETAS